MIQSIIFYFKQIFQVTQFAASGHPAVARVTKRPEIMKQSCLGAGHRQRVSWCWCGHGAVRERGMV